MAEPEEGKKGELELLGEIAECLRSIKKLLTYLFVLGVLAIIAYGFLHLAYIFR